MTENEIQENRNLFLNAARTYIRRGGIIEVLSYLDNKTDFFYAPASSYLHLCEPGGLCKHSLNVFETALRIYKSTLEPHAQGDDNACFDEIPEESIAIASLFHDVWKCNRFHPCKKSRKDAHGLWGEYTTYEEKDSFPFGFGEKSCLMLSAHMQLNKKELLAIRWQHGAFEAGEAGSKMRKAFYAACRQSPLVALLQAADNLSTLFIDPKEYY